jgi:hypothetical protein
MLNFCKIFGGAVIAMSSTLSDGFIVCPKGAKLGWTHNGTSFSRVDLPSGTAISRTQSKKMMSDELDTLEAKMEDGTATLPQIKRAMFLIIKLRSFS